jgi:hypothetical protein
LSNPQLDRHPKAVADPTNSLNDLSAPIAYSHAQLSHCGGKGRLNDFYTWPHRLHELFFGDDLAHSNKKLLEQSERLWFDITKLPANAQFTASFIVFYVGKPPNTGLKSGSILVALRRQNVTPPGTQDRRDQLHFAAGSTCQTLMPRLVTVKYRR